MGVVSYTLSDGMGRGRGGRCKKRNDDVHQRNDFFRNKVGNAMANYSDQDNTFGARKNKMIHK